MREQGGPNPTLAGGLGVLGLHLPTNSLATNGNPPGGKLAAVSVDKRKGGGQISLQGTGQGGQKHTRVGGYGGFRFSSPPQKTRR